MYMYNTRTLCSNVFHLMPSGCGSSSHHFHTSGSSSFFLRPPFVGEAVAAFAAPFLGVELALVATPLFFFGGVATIGLAAADADLLLDGVFFDFFG